MQLPTLPQAVLWDMDGTLINSEPLWMGGEEKLMAQNGLTWGHDDALQMIGMALPDGATVLQNAGLRMENRAIVDWLVDHVLSGLRKNVEWRPGAKELLLALHDAGVPQALVTMSEAPLAAALIEGLPTNPFQAVVTGDMVTNGKPNPEPYLRALERLAGDGEALTPSQCIAFEDSRPGTASAMAAGVVTVGIPFMQGLPRHGDLHLMTSLEGVTPASLADFLHDVDRRTSQRA